MSQENIVRKPLLDTRSASRTFDERLMLRFPRLSLAVGRFVLRLPARSRLRQTVIWRYVGQGFAGVNRRDFEAVLPKYNPRVEINRERQAPMMVRRRRRTASLSDQIRTA